MDELKILCIALSVAALAGVNLYLTFVLLGVSLKMGWFTLGTDSGFSPLLTDTNILIAVGVLAIVEFLVSKVNWMDTFWDILHTVIRPLGGAFIGATILGGALSFWEVLFVLACGGVALVSHSIKAGAKVMVRTSVEGVSAGVLTIAENLVIVLGALLIYKFPYAAGVLTLVMVGFFVYLFPKLFRMVREASVNVMESI